MQRERCQLPTPVALLKQRSRLRAGKSGRAKSHGCGKTGALALRPWTGWRDGGEGKKAIEN
jgi:hypothetical protein